MAFNIMAMRNIINVYDKNEKLHIIAIFSRLKKSRMFVGNICTAI